MLYTCYIFAFLFKHAFFLPWFVFQNVLCLWKRRLFNQNWVKLAELVEYFISYLNSNDSLFLRYQSPIPAVAKSFDIIPFYISSIFCMKISFANIDQVHDVNPREKVSKRTTAKEAESIYNHAIAYRKFQNNAKSSSCDWAIPNRKL